MTVYKYDKNFYGYIKPMPSDILELDDGTRLKVVGCSPGEGCQSCVLDNPWCHADMDQELLYRLCRHTTCYGVFREDGISIHYEEASDAT